MDATQPMPSYLSFSRPAFIEKLLNLDEAKRYRLVTCGEGALHLSLLLRQFVLHILSQRPTWLTTEWP